MINMIVCMDKGDGIGVNGGLLYHLKGDLKHFRQKTLGTTIIMGRKTFESLPNVLPHREHWVITRDTDYKVPSGVRVFHSREDVLKELGDRRAFVIGGSSIYDMFINDVTSIYATKVDKKKKADTYFKFSRDDFSWSQIGTQQCDVDDTTFASTGDNIGVVVHITDFMDRDDVIEQLNHYRWSYDAVKIDDDEVVAIIYLRVGIGRNFQYISKRLGCMVQVNPYSVVYGLGAITTYKSGNLVNYSIDFDDRYEWWLVWGDKSTLLSFDFIDFDDGDSPYCVEDNELIGYEFSDDEIDEFTERLNTGYNCGF